MKDLKLKDNERILDEVRQYGLTLFWSWLAGFVFLMSAAFFMFYLLEQDTWGIPVFLGLIVVGLFVLFRTYFLWQKNVAYITTHRVIDIDQQGFFHRIVSEVPYDQLEDVHGKIKGMWGTIFRYGHVNIQTGNGKVKIIIPHIKRPLQLQQQINEMRDRYLSKYSHDFSGDVAGAIIDKLYELEIPDLRRVQKVLDKRVSKLSRED